MKSNLTGCVIEFSPNLKLKLKDQIGYGSFSFVYSTNDPRYVVKMINASDPKSLHSYNNEKFAFQNIKKHENIINCPAFKDNTSYKGITYCCLALENCPRGSIITMIVDKKMVFQETQVLQIFLDALLGVHQMHNTSPQPIAHRDLKGENILLGLDGRFKLTDFGSITIKKVFDITRENREAIQEDIDKSTTPTIRAPEQCDLYSGFPITEKVDVWALGCLLYILCFQKQPFETKLSTINCQYFMVDAHKYSKKLIELFPLFFVVDPKKRPNTAFILNHFEANFQSIPRTPFEAPAQLNTSTKPQKNTKQMEAQYVSSFGDFGKSGMPTEFMVDRRDSQGIKPSFKDAWHKKIKTITTKTQAWMLTAVEETEDGPTQRFIRYLIIKAWQKPHKIKKFYDVTQKKLMKSLENTIIILKALILLHNYTKKGPNDVYFQKSTPNVSYPKDLYRAILDTWKMIVESNKMSSRDKARSSYISNIIIEYTQVLSKKTDLLQHYFRIIEGSYSINPFLSHPGEDNSPVNESVIRDLLDYLQSLIDFHKIILIHRNLWTIQCNLALSVLDEEFSLISLLTHLIVAFKKSSNYAPSKTNATATRENIQKLEEKFISCYQQLQKLFEHARKVDGFVDRSSMIPVLPNEVIKGVQSISILNPPKEQEFYAKEHLSTSKSIYSLKIPMSYGTFVKNINLEQIICKLFLCCIILNQNF